jgi:hypothetical protein
MTAVTESEAHAKWCPLVKEPNGSAAPQKHTHCIASACMAWRWAPRQAVEDMATKVMRGGKVDEVLSEMKEPKGYCGAFGAP